MFLKRANVLLLFLLNISVALSLRFFQSRKRKKKCLVREQWNFHYVTCPSKYHNCCATGCCPSAINNATTAYVKACIVCSVIIVIFTFIYIESWCKKKCKNLKNTCSGNGRNEVVPVEDAKCELEELKSPECDRWMEMQALKTTFSTNGTDDNVTLSSVCSDSTGSISNKNVSD